MLEDLRVTLRTVVRGRWFSVTAVIILALGGGFNTAIFSVINAVLYRPPPVHAPGELRYIYQISPRNRGPMGLLSFRDFLEVREQRDLFTEVTLVDVRRERIRTASTIERAQGERVASNYFECLGVTPIIGRGFVGAEDEAVTAERVVIISHDLWRSGYASDPNIVGKTLELSSDSWFGSYAPWRPFTIVGVMPPSFKGMANPWDATMYWVPFLRDAADAVDMARQVRGVNVRIGEPADYSGLPIVRLRSGVTSEQAASWVQDFGERLRRVVRPSERDWSLQLFDARVIALPFDPAGTIVPARLAAAFLCVSAVVLLIAASNLASLLMARGVARRSELAVRLTLGATHARLLRQLMTESVLLSVAGGLLGILLAKWLVDLFMAGTPSRSVQWNAAGISLDVPIDWRVVAFTAGSCLLTGLVVGLIPARRVLRGDLLPGLAGQSALATPATKTPLQRWVVIPQVCLSLVLLLLAGVLTRTMTREEMRNPGYDGTGVVLLDVDTRFERSGIVVGAAARDAERVKAGNEERLGRIQRLLAQLSTVPGVTAATIAPRVPTTPLPLASMKGWIAPRDGFAPDGRHTWVSQMDVSPGYFTTLRIPLLRGRDFDARDRRDSAPVTIVSETLARTLWPNGDPIGQHLAGHEPNSGYAPKWREVVGVVGDVRLPLTDTMWSPAIYTPTEQAGMGLPSMIVARGEGSPAQLMQRLSAAVVAADPEALAVNGRLMTQGIDELLYPRRIAIVVLTLAGVVGLLLASSGLYGLISYSVAQRTREIGVRMALGADRRDILRLVVREGVGVSAAGVMLGLILTDITIRAVSRWVVVLPSIDLLTFLVVPVLLAGVILLACYLPALRAARVEPMSVLRGL